MNILKNDESFFSENQSFFDKKFKKNSDFIILFYINLLKY